MTRSHKVMHVVEAFGGGVFQSVRQLCAATPDVETVVVHDIRAETPDDFAVQYPAHVKFIQLTMGRAINPVRDLGAAWRLRKLVKAERPTVVHAHSSKAGALARAGLLGLGIPVFYSPRGYAFLMDDCPPKKRFVYQAVEWLLGRLPATTVACGYDELEPAKTVSRKAICIPNALDTADIPAAARKRPILKKGEVLQVVSSGRISPQKNFATVCEVARRLEDKPIAFTWVGGGEMNAVTPPANMRVTGWLNHADAIAEVRKGHVFLHLSRWEGLSRVLLEAMAHGFPLVTSRVSGNIELTSGNNGALCNDADDAVAALTHFMDYPDQIADMGAASTALLEKNYTWSTNQKVWRKTYGLDA